MKWIKNKHVICFQYETNWRTEKNESRMVLLKWVKKLTIMEKIVPCVEIYNGYSKYIKNYIN